MPSQNGVYFVPFSIERRSRVKPQGGSALSAKMRHNVAKWSSRFCAISDWASSPRRTPEGNLRFLVSVATFRISRINAPSRNGADYAPFPPERRFRVKRQWGTCVSPFRLQRFVFRGSTRQRKMGSILRRFRLNVVSARNASRETAFSRFGPNV